MCIRDSAYTHVHVSTALHTESRRRADTSDELHWHDALLTLVTLAYAHAYMYEGARGQLYSHVSRHVRLALNLAMWLC